MDDGSCTVSCGHGKQAQYRYTKVHPDHGGVPCPRTIEQFIDCSPDPCPVDCVISVWSGWTPCDKTCGPGTSTRIRFEEVEAIHGGKECTHSTEQTKDCEVKPCPINCEFGEWTEWGKCDEACGPGRHDRKRVIECSIYNNISILTIYYN
jgi:hypothetical protein